MKILLQVGLARRRTKLARFNSRFLERNWTHTMHPIIETFISTLSGGIVQPRISLQAAPGGYHAMLGLENYLHQSSLEEPLLLLIKVRASQINGCAYY